MATEAQLRKEYVDTALAYLGVKQWSKKHKEIIDIFNTVKPDGWSMTYNAFWCATFASAMGIKAFGKSKAEMVFPLSANCGTIVNKAKAMGMWVEKDSYKPKKGDWILYDWNDSGAGDCLGSPDHVGIVQSVGANITVIEGNKDAAVGKRIIPVNGRYIRGFVVPKYSRIATKHTNAYYFRKKLKQITAYANKHDFTYVRQYGKCAKTWEGTKKIKRMNCQMAVCLALQEAGLIPLGKSFYFNGEKFKGQNGYTLKDFKKIATLTHPEKPPEKLKMKKGDICGYSPAHTMAYEGRKKGVPTWYSWGGSDVGDKQPKVKPSYTDKKIASRARLK